MRWQPCCSRKGGEEALPAAPGPEVKLGPVGPEVLVGPAMASVVPSTCGWGLLGEQSHVHWGEKKKKIGIFEGKTFLKSLGVFPLFLLAAQTPDMWSCCHHPALSVGHSCKQIGATQREINKASWPGSSLLPVPRRCVGSPQKGKCHFSLPPCQKRCCVLHLCLAEAFPPLCKGHSNQQWFQKLQRGFWHRVVT